MITDKRLPVLETELKDMLKAEFAEFSQIENVPAEMLLAGDTGIDLAVKELMQTMNALYVIASTPTGRAILRDLLIL